jgi:ketosteroid isomerase-like protein
MVMTENELAALAANERFYRALETADLAAMEALWLHTDWVKCTHPGWDLCLGWEAIRQSWAQIFAVKSRMRVAATEVSITLENDFASISCLEQLAIFTNENSAPQAVTTNATNLFQRVAGEWRMIHHHASVMRNVTILPDEKD